MTVHNQLSRLSEVQRGAKVAFGLDSGAGGLERLGESIQVVRDFWALPGDAFLRGERWCQGSASVAAGGAGNFSAAAFSCEVAGWIAHLERVVVSSDAAGILVIKRGLALPTPSNNRVFRDMRASAGLPMSRITSVNNVAAAPGGTTCFLARVPVAGSNISIPLDWTLVTGGPVATEVACVVYHATANVELLTSFYWRERQLLPGEHAR